MATRTPVEIISLILAELWASQSSIEEHIRIFLSCSLVSKKWSALIKEVNSTHSFIPFSYNAGQLYAIKSLSSISSATLCRTITFRIEYVTVPRLLRLTKCTPTIEANRGIENILRRIFRGPSQPSHATHIFVDYVDDPQVHIPRFWIPRQITHLTLVYHYRLWVCPSFRRRLQFHCGCERLPIDRHVSHLSVMGATPVIVQRLIAPLNEWQSLVSLTTDADVGIPVALRESSIRRKYDFPIQDVHPDVGRLAMFGEQFNRAYGSHRHPIIRDLHSYISMLEQVIPLGSVGYINPLTKKFVVLFNAIDPASSPEPEIQGIPSLIASGVTKLVVNPKYSSSPGWEYEYKFSDITLRLQAWIEGRSVYDIPAGVDDGWAMLYLTLGRAVSRELQGDHLESWLLEHQQTIRDVFGNDHPYARKHLDLVTTTVDSSQYAWFAHLGQRSTQSFDAGYFYFRVTSRIPGSPWGEFKIPEYYSSPAHVLYSWSHVSTVGQSPMTVEIRCLSTPKKMQGYRWIVP
ncbi:uncharacterized protein ARMOST_04689 [Armillaria ostoyae]|uniref:Uncharacterized protein n=1 Tax=Armillaria ostoyae TaxID=47428 RepID=A0A284QY19_ARMOS|nr:uncharacterized protein ARMOST_04689 [Armillaria ostoyae]